MPTVTISSAESSDELAGRCRPSQRAASHQFAASHFDGLDRIGGPDRSPDAYARPWRSNSLTPLAPADANGERRSSYTQFGGIGPVGGAGLVFPSKAR